MLSIDGRFLGRKKPLFANWSISLPPELEDGDGGVSLRELITRIVLAEVQTFRDRQDECIIAESERRVSFDGDVVC